MTTSHRSRLSPRLLGTVAAVAGLSLAVLYLAGAFGGHRVPPGTHALPPVAIAGDEHVATVRVVPDTVDWPGLVRSRVVANVAPKVLARIQEVRVQMGSVVRGGDPLVILDARDLEARRQQAVAAVRAAEAEAQHAAQEERRVRALFEQQAATQQELDAVTARARASRAAYERARDALAEAETALSETVLRAPFDGVVASRLADPGDLGVPGQPIVVVHDPAALRFEAAVGESCASALVVGESLPIRLDLVPGEVLGRVDELSPQADVHTRTVRVKLVLPEHAGVRPGTYGILQTVCGQHTALLVPSQAVIRRGQLEFVYVRTPEGSVLRHVRSGKLYGDQVEIVSGLEANERVIVPAQKQG